LNHGRGIVDLQAPFAFDVRSPPLAATTAMSRAVEQIDPENLLKAAHELANGGRRYIQLICGGGNVT
jgi:hypothetical protein